MENGQKKLKELFDGRKIFKIPNYQRAYAWEDSKHLPDFIEDIENQSVDRYYFLGTILFQEKGGKKSGFDIIEIVDGQQRITTVIIFMKALLYELGQRLSKEEYEDNGLDLAYETYIESRKRPKLQAISSDDDFFQTYILDDDDGSQFIETPSQRRLFKAKRYFTEILKKYETNDLINLKIKVDESTNVLTYSVKDSAEATLIFETTNDRGKGLTNLEKIKSFLMYKIYLSADDDVDTRLTSIQQRFTDIFRDLEMFDGKIDEDTVLQYHCIAFERWKDKDDYQNPVQYIRKKLNPLIKQGSNKEAVDFIENFSKKLKESFRIMRDLLRSNSSSYRDLSCLERLGNFNPLLLKCLKFDKTKEKIKFDTACQLLEIFSFRIFALQQNRSNTGQAKLFKEARDFSGKFDPLFDHLSDLIGHYSPKKRFKEHLEYTDFYQFMSSRDMSYLMWKYENFLRQTEQPICTSMSEKEYRNPGHKTRLTVEHIASQNPEEHGIIHNKAILPKISESFLDNHIHRLGNLTFDPASANSSKGNKNIKTKNSKHFKKAPYKTQNELETFLDNGEWSIDSIEKREAKIIKFCLKKWNPDYVEY